MKLWHDMKNRWQTAHVSQPWWDGSRVQFAMEADGKLIRCAISRSALQKVSGHPHLATRDLLRRFVDSRERVEEIATRIFHITPEWVSGPVSIWADDIDDSPTAFALTRQIVPFMSGVRCNLALVSRT
jgi:hypothetical protein